MRPLLFCILAATLIPGCRRRDILDHSIGTRTFEDQVKFVWKEQSNWEGTDTVAGWGFGIAADDGLADHQVRYTLHLYDSVEKHLIIASTDRAGLPIEPGTSSHDEHGKKALEEGWRMWLDYEVYSPGGDMILKGSMLSEPCPETDEAKETIPEAVPNGSSRPATGS